MMILLAGPYRSDTSDNPDRMAANLRQLEAAARPLFRASHLPMIDEWVALPLLAQAGSTQPDDAAYQEILYPVAQRLLDKCVPCFACLVRRPELTRMYSSPSSKACQSIITWMRY